LERPRGPFALILISLFLLIPTGVMIVLHRINQREFERLSVDIDKVVSRFRVQAKVIFESSSLCRLAKPGEPVSSQFSLTVTSGEEARRRYLSWQMLTQRKDKGWRHECEVRLVQARWLFFSFRPRLTMHGLESPEGSLKALFDSLMSDQGVHYDPSDATDTP